MKKQILFSLLLLLGSVNLWAADTRSNDQFDEQLLSLQERWAAINYQAPQAEREKDFEKLAVDAERFVQANPTRAEPLIWKGIIVSTWAGARGGMGALGLVKEARALFEKSLQMDPNALSGSAYTSLGSLYYQVPGWPIAFGSDSKAREMLDKALEINPYGIDSNYFYGDYWMEEGEYAKAKVYFMRAMQAAPRSSRPIADKGRRTEILAKLDIIDKKLH